MSLLSRLFGGGGGGSAAPEPEPERYRGFAIRPEPMREGGKYRLAAHIERSVEGTPHRQTIIRADMFDGLDAASEAAIRKAKQVIDERYGLDPVFAALPPEPKPDAESGG